MVLQDVLTPNMRIVFCGTAVSDTSAERGDYYAHPTNKFWKILHKIGLTPKELSPNEYQSLTHYGLGLTDLVKTKSGLDKKLTPNDFDIYTLTTKIKEFKPDILCFNGKNSASMYLSRAKIDFGFQPEKITTTRIFVAPSTSGSANGYWDEKWWFILAHSIERPFQAVDIENYYKPDRITDILVNLNGDGSVTKTNEADFIKAVENIKLHNSIPTSIQNIFEVARALFAYGYLYNPFCTIALEQAFKAFEAVVSLKFEINGGPESTRKLAKKIDYLYSLGVITTHQKEMLDAIRYMRNDSFHPEYQQLVGHNVEWIEAVATIINGLWLAEGKELRV
ncbi:G:T/U mismatch-specific DNA glycosylase [Desulfosporosinus acidiphilus SJ4]|uniref:G:T/U mismatch-specific DNA glycosylase n=1 Tax=Desulfosporosinus acidiphilus (strain DSM 22704 / JCM 16185 / SJ4) TaxID=646529 RepID=I4D5H2_DESAJ|nr:uracil-DNA glycosylase family protein [Desulfosporosinus acidiphilus]AFM41046.1 G:T/U mismatch-specific DNA glycosylase [Desulfosporosinus acidiphilus SJ4]